MHDPLVVAFEIPAPIPRHLEWRDPKPGQPRWALHRRRRTNPENRGQPVYHWWRPAGYSLVVAGRALGLNPVVTVWHREPRGADSGTICKHYVTTKDAGRKPTEAWRWHFWHWKIQVHATQWLKRRLWSRCAECGRSFRRRDMVIGTSWNGKGPRWFRGEPDIIHRQCSELRGLRGQRERWANISRNLVAWVELATGRSEERIVDLVCGSTSGWPYQERRDLAYLLGYESDDGGRWRKAPAQEPTPTATPRTG